MNIGRLFFVLFLSLYIGLHFTLDAQSHDSQVLSTELSLINDFSKVLTGGIQKNELDHMGFLSLNLALNTENAGLWKGGELNFHLLNTHGAQVSGECAGDLQVFSNIEAGESTRIFELFYSQQIKKFKISAGWNDLNADYCVSENSSLLINSSFGIIPTISINVPVSIFPVTAPFVDLTYSYSNISALSIASYWGNPGTYETNKYNLNWQLNNRDGLFTIIQYAYTNTDNNFYLNAGFYNHSGHFNNLIDSNNYTKNNYGFYFNFDKAFSNLIRDQLAFFGQVGLAPSNKNLADYYLGTGLLISGLIRHDKISDTFSFGIAYMNINKLLRRNNPDIKRYETAIEFNYQININEHLSLQPDVQYILNPGAGINGNISNALVGTIRLAITY